MSDTPVLKKLALRNLKCFKSATLDLDPKMNILIGENGAGKTTIAEVIASLSHGPDEGLRDFPLRHGTKTGEAKLYLEGQSAAAANWKVSRGVDSRQELPNDHLVFAYGRYRRVISPEGSQLSNDPYFLIEDLVKRAGKDRTVTLDQPDNNLLADLSLFVGAIWIAKTEIDPEYYSILWDRLEESLKELAPAINGLEMHSMGSERVPVVMKHGIPLPFSQLSDGYQAILVVVLDLILRYRALFPGLEDPLSGRATVIIDEVDLHLHPRWQRTVGAQLQNLFPETQFILTTHSPAVVQGAIDNRQHIVVCECDESEVTLRRITDYRMRKLQGAGIDSLLLEDELFDVRSRYSTKYSKIEEKISSIRRRIKDGEATEKDYSRLGGALDQIQELVLKEEERRADGGFMSQLSKLRVELVKDLAKEARKKQERREKGKPSIIEVKVGKGTGNGK